MYNPFERDSRLISNYEKTRVPGTLKGIRTSHAVAIKTEGVTIGMIQSWAPTQSRTVSPRFELNAATDGRVSENIPGNISGLTITINRYDLIKSKMEELWGSIDFTMLTDQANPLTIKERWDYEDGSTEVWAYMGCWFTSLGRNLSAEGNRIVGANATLTYSLKKKVDAEPSSIQEAFRSFKKYFKTLGEPGSL